MAEAIAAFYAVESTLEATAVGVYAVSGATVPLKARFRRIQSPSEEVPSNNVTIESIKGKVYVLGGTAEKALASEQLCVLSMPSDFGASRVKDNDPVDVDFESIQPHPVDQHRPLRSDLGSENGSLSCTGHSTVTIGDKIYLVGGRNQSGSLVELRTIASIDTHGNAYSVETAVDSKCTEGIPPPRSRSSCTSSPYPQPVHGLTPGAGPTLDAHGTIFLHGGYDESGQPLHDTWTFDVGTGAWHKFPSIQDLQLEGISTSGKIVYVDHRLWYVNDSVVMHLDLAEHEPEQGTALQDPSLFGTGRVGSGQWQTVYPPAVSDPNQKAAALEHVPTGLEHVLPLTTGSGRMFLLGIASSARMHTFQIPAKSSTLAAAKDVIRDQSTKILPDSWRSGKHEWAKVEIQELDEKNGLIERPDENLAGFATAVRTEDADSVILWGGRSSMVEADTVIDRAAGWLITFA